MAKPKDGAAATETAESSSRGRAVILANGERRVDYIRRRFYDDKIERGAIKKELKEKFDHEVAYQIVFQATKEKTKPVPKAPETEEEKSKDASKPAVGASSGV